MTRLVHRCLAAPLLFYTITTASAQVPRRKPLPPGTERPAAKEQEAQNAQPSMEREDQAQIDRELKVFRDMQARRALLERMRYGDQGSSVKIIEQLGALLAVFSILAALLWILRVVLENRRWQNAARVQAELHNKLVEKFGSSREIFDYLGSDAGKHFLEWTPLPLEQPAGAPFPFGRILWSVQAGVILIFVGGGMLFLRGYLPGPAEQFLILGALVMSLGIGFILSSAISYLLSRSFGLLERTSGAGSRGNGS